MKKCSKCLEELPYEMFHKHKRSKDGYRYHCKECRKAKDLEYYENNKEKILERTREYYYDNPDVILRNRRKWLDSDKSKEAKKKWANSENGKKSKQRYYQENKEHIKENVKKNRENNKEYYLNYDRNRRNEYNRKKYLKEYQREWIDKDRKENPHIHAWRSTLKSVLIRMGTKKSSSTLEMLGYSADELKDHMESLFTEGMSWDNWGEWHIDHIKPVSVFDPETDVSMVNALENLQPLWAIENLIKGSAYNE